MGIKVKQTESPARRRKRKPRNGNGKNRRTAKQLERQEKVFLLNLQGISTRELARDFKCSQNTILADLRHEELRRSDELASRREGETARSVAMYQDVIRRALAKSDMYDAILASSMAKADKAAAEYGDEDPARERRGKTDYQAAGIHVTDRSLDAVLKAQERIDKIRGIDAPTKVEVGVQGLIEALALKDGEPEIRA